MNTTHIRRALISVYYKDGIVPLAQALCDAGVEILASGGTAKTLQAAGINALEVSQYTGAPEILGGRVKTLHPKIHAGILADRNNPKHLDELEEQGFGPIDLVVCNLYPFTDKLKAGADERTLIETIDIGGPTMIRAAAKNADGGVAVVCEPCDYTTLASYIKADQPVCIPKSERLRLAATAFKHVATYDSAIAGWTHQRAYPDASSIPTALPETLPAFIRHGELRYGENPHQKAALYREAPNPIDHTNQTGAAFGQQLAGKALSYNNYLDLHSAYIAAQNNSGAPRCAIVKHTNPCGLAEASTQTEAFEQALSGDPVSAFGSIIGFNQPLGAAAAEAIKATKLFVECIAAPSITLEAQAILEKKTNLRLIEMPPGDGRPTWHMHRIGGGLLVQQSDRGAVDPKQWTCVTQKQLEPAWLDELAFAMDAAALLKSNAIAITKAKALLGAGTGQMSRVDATEHAITKASREGQPPRGAFLASDAFFPFSDCVTLAGGAGIVAIVQPGGSKRDQESIDACDAQGIAMVFTGTRHFRH